MANIFEKILYGLRVVNDNILVLNEKMETLIGILSCHENVIGMEEGDEDEQH